MSLVGCIMMCFIFYPAIFALSYFMRCWITFSIGIFAIFMGALITYFIYHDKEFWYGWVPYWRGAAEIGFGYSALFSGILYLLVFMLLVPKFRKMLERYSPQ